MSLPATSPMIFMTSDVIRGRPPLVDDGEIGAEALREGPAHLDAADVGRDDRDVLHFLPPNIFKEHRRRKKIIDLNVEKSLNLRRVKLEGEDAIRARTS